MSCTKIYTFHPRLFSLLLTARAVGRLSQGGVLTLCSLICMRPQDVYWRSWPPTTESQTKVRLYHQGHNPVFLNSHFVCMQSTKRLTSSYMTTETSGSLMWNPHIKGTHSVIFQQVMFSVMSVCLCVCSPLESPPYRAVALVSCVGPWPCPSSVQGLPPGHVQTFFRLDLHCTGTFPSPTCSN